MPKYDLPYGKHSLTLNIPDHIIADIILPKDMQAIESPEELVAAAIENSAGKIKLEDYSHAKSVAIAINDRTRPVPHEYLLPPLLAHLKKIGFSPDQIKLIVATGTHTPMEPDSFSQILPPSILSQYDVRSHDCDDEETLVNFGFTSRGTLILINRYFADADLKIVVGNIEPHHFMGYSGGVKSAAIGLAGRQTININHTMLIEPESRIAEYDNNPTRQDIEEIGRIINVHFALNAILNQKRQIVYAFAGTPLAVMQQGIPLAREVCQTRVTRKYKLVISSPGGHPKDINLYQAQKALSHASLITEDGGTVILVAACPEGSGSSSYEEFMGGITTPEQVFEKTRKLGFAVGPHKALQFAREQTRINILLVSELDKSFAEKLLLKPAVTIDQALQMVLETCPALDRIGVLPKAINTIPIV